MVKGLGDWEQRLSTALVKSTPGGLVRAEPRPSSPAGPSSAAAAGGGGVTVARKTTRDR